MKLSTILFEIQIQKPVTAVQVIDLYSELIRDNKIDLRGLALTDFFEKHKRPLNNKIKDEYVDYDVWIAGLNPRELISLYNDLLKYRDDNITEIKIQGIVTADQVIDLYDRLTKSKKFDAIGLVRNGFFKKHKREVSSITGYPTENYDVWIRRLNPKELINLYNDLLDLLEL